MFFKKQVPEDVVRIVRTVLKNVEFQKFLILTFGIHPSKLKIISESIGQVSKLNESTIDEFVSFVVGVLSSSLMYMTSAEGASVNVSKLTDLIDRYYNGEDVSQQLDTELLLRRKDLEKRNLEKIIYKANKRLSQLDSKELEPVK